MGIKTLVLLSPWLVYVFVHFPLFLEQMQTQFKRLEHGNPLVGNLYMLFHSQFLSFGNVAELPKFLVFGKAIFWLLMIWSITFLMMRFWRRPQAFARVDQMALFLFIATFYLWMTKGEFWFVSMVHWTLWPCVGAAVAASRSTRTIRFVTAGLTGLGLVFVLSTVGQQWKTPSSANWKNYQLWVDCLVESTEALSSHQASPIVFQPHVPDVLVRTSQLRPHWDLTRALDFPFLRDNAERFLLERADVTIFTRVFVNERDTSSIYQGKIRSIDQSILSTDQSVPFGSLALLHKGETRVCQYGVFWGAVYRPMPRSG